MFEHWVLEIQVLFVFVLNFQYITDVEALAWDMHTNVTGLTVCNDWSEPSPSYIWISKCNAGIIKQ